MTNAAAVARVLKKAGLTTVPRHNREGLWVANSYAKSLVTMGVSFAETTYIPGWARRKATDAAEVLAEAGYVVEAFSGDDSLLFHITKEVT